MKERIEMKPVGAEPIPPALVAEARRGDQAAFTELYERTNTMLYRTIRSMVRDEDLVWDILQDSYLRAWRSLDKLEADEAFVSWLRRIAVNAAATALSKRTPLTFTDLAGPEDESEPDIPDLSVDTQPELALDRKETSRLVRELLGSLSPAQQAVIGMYYYEDMPVKDIAALLKVSASTVKNQLSRGRKKVETGVRALEKQGVRLYGLSPLPFLMALLGRLEPTAREQKKVLDAVLTEAPAAAGTSAVTVTALTASQVFLKGLGVKLIAVATAAALIVGGKLGYDALKKGDTPLIGTEQPTAELTDPDPAVVGLPVLYIDGEAYPVTVEDGIRGLETVHNGVVVHTYKEEYLPEADAYTYTDVFTLYQAEDPVEEEFQGDPKIALDADYPAEIEDMPSFAILRLPVSGFPLRETAVSDDEDFQALMEENGLVPFGDQWCRCYTESGPIDTSSPEFIEMMRDYIQSNANWAPNNQDPAWVEQRLEQNASDIAAIVAHSQLRQALKSGQSRIGCSLITERSEKTGTVTSYIYLEAKEELIRSWYQGWSPVLEEAIQPKD